MTFLTIGNNLVCIQNSLSLNCWLFLIKMFYQFVKDSFVVPSISLTNNSNVFKKNSVYQKTFYLNSFLLFISTFLQNLCHHITRNRYRNRYTLNKKSCLYWRGIASYLYSQLMKLLLISRNMNYSRKNLIYLQQVYNTFQSILIKLENQKKSLPLKRFIVHFLATLNPRKLKFT